MFADFPRFVVLVWFLDHFWRISAHLPDCAMQLKQTEAGTFLYLGRILKLFIRNLNENVKSSYIMKHRELGITTRVLSQKLRNLQISQ